MPQNAEVISYYHLSGAMLAPGSTIMPGNWGRVVRAYGWQHNQALREMALEEARRARFPERPSRLDAAFVFLTLEEARNFRQNVAGFAQHILYQVTLCDLGAISHVTDSRLCAPQGTFRHDWADIYWMDTEIQAAAMPGIDWAAVTNQLRLREMLTLSPLRVEERLD
jgi:hypothetical protein